MKILVLLTIIIVSISSISCSFENSIVEWEDGEIPYYLSGDFSNEDIENLVRSMEMWENACGVRFIEVTPRSYAYEIIRIHEKNCWASSIGENNVNNHMFFCDSADSLNHILHELGHCIGLLHEHQRPDRDTYVMVLWEKILPEYENNFIIRDNPLIIEQNFSYDFKSVMHYHSRGFSIDGSETIIPLDGSVIERSNTLTIKDVEKGVSIYGPPKSDDE